MPRQGVPYDLTNFFLNSLKTKFFLNLNSLDNEKKITLYDVRNKSRITSFHSKIILKSLEHYNLITVDYKSGLMIVNYTEEGQKLRKKIIEFGNYLKKLDIWRDKNFSAKY